MATIEKRGGAWRAKIRLRGSVLNATFDSKEEARTWVASEEAKILKGAKAAKGQSEAVFQLVADLMDRYAEEVSPKKRGERWEVIRLAKMRREKAFQVPVRDFGPDQMADWRDARLKEVSPASVNREMNLISGVFTVAIKKWRVGLPANPVHLTERPKNPKARKRRVSEAEMLAIRAKLGWNGTTRPNSPSEWTAWAHEMAIETTMRSGEVLEMTRRRVDLPRKVAHLLDGEEKDVPGQTKTGQGRVIPLSRRARELFQMAGDGDPDAPIAEVTKASRDVLFRRAKKAAGIVNMRFHDSRREATTRIAPKVGNSMDLAKITGHRDHRQLMEYYEPDATELAEKLD